MSTQSRSFGITHECRWHEASFTNMTANSTISLTKARRALESAGALADSLKRLGSNPQPEYVDTLFERTLTGAVTAHDALQLLPVIIEATEAGHACILELTDDDGELDIVWRSGSEPAISGDPGFLIEPGERNNLRRFLEAGDVAGTLSMLEGRQFNMRASLRFRSQAVAWVPSLQILVSSLTSDAWLSTLLQLWQRSDDGHLTLLVDELDQVVRTQSITFVPSGLSKTLTRLPSSEAPRQASQFARARVEQGWPDVPLPSDLVPDASEGGNLVAALVSLAHATAWMWLSVEPPAVGPASVVVRYRGVRDVELALTPPSDVDSETLGQALALWRWTTAAGDDPVRIDATQRAITLAVAAAADLPGAAGPALRTARTLYDLATRGAVVEAMAARRAGRDAAASAAHKAATAAREAAGKATERSLTLMVAAAAVVFATVQKVLDWYVSVGALAGLALLLIGSLLVAVKVDLAIATDSLDGFDEDLSDYRESLSEDDIRQIRASAAVRHARNNIASARKAAVWVYSICALAAVALAIGFMVVRPR